jgi:hypothetical protein
MIRRIASVASLAALAFLPLLASARADEIKLKDGTKIIGTIVGFEDNSFKVKTSYGFAVVRKDQVVSITVTGDGKQPEPDSAKTPEAANAKKPDANAVKKSDPAAAKTPVAAPAPPAVKPEKVEHASAPPAQTTATMPAKTPEFESRSAADNSVVEYPHSDAPTSPAKNSAATAANARNASNAPTSVAATTPPKPVAPEPMREEVSGNLYTNDTYGFQMYKPPTWKLIEGARTILPGSITALGTDDQNTYLLIGQEPSGKSLANDIAATEQRLHALMDNFRPLGEKQVMISGVSATERRFRGSVDARDWSGIVVYVPHGTRVYTIFGMTLADTDLVQIQENVISRAITSLQFTK